MTRSPRRRCGMPTLSCSLFLSTCSTTAWSRTFDMSPTTCARRHSFWWSSPSAGASRRADGVREAAVRDALGHFADQVPWVECDAQTYLDALHEDDASRASGPRRSVADWHAPARDQPYRARTWRPGSVPRPAAAGRAGRWRSTRRAGGDENDEAVLAILARQRRAFTNRRGLLDSALERSATEFRSACLRAAEQLADRSR